MALQAVRGCGFPGAGCPVHSTGGGVTTKVASKLLAKSGKRKIGSAGQLANQVSQGPVHCPVLPGKQETRAFDRVIGLAVEQDIAQQLVQPRPLGPGSDRRLDLPQAAVDDSVAVGAAHVRGPGELRIESGGGRHAIVGSAA